MAPKRVIFSVVAVVSLVGAGLLVPLPLGGIRQTALVQTQPEAYEKVFVPVPGILERLYIRDGQYVAKGDILAEFSSLDLETHLAEARGQYETRIAQIAALREQAGKALEPLEKNKYAVLASRADGEQKRYRQEMDLYAQAATGC